MWNEMLPVTCFARALNKVSKHFEHKINVHVEVEGAFMTLFFPRGYGQFYLLEDDIIW